MSILIVGGFGYIGSSLFNYLYNLNKNIIIIDNLSNSYLNEINIIHINKLNIKKYLFDICNEEKLKNIFYENIISCVIWCIDTHYFINYTYYNSNIKGLLVLINLMNLYKIENFIYLSSYEVYKYDDNIKEDSICSPITNEGKIKLLSEDIIKNVYNYKYYILRLSDVIGKNIYDFTSIRLNIFNQIYIKNKLNCFDKNIYINNKIDYIYINDLCFIINKLLKKILKLKINKLIINVSTSNKFNEIDLLNNISNDYNIIYKNNINLTLDNTLLKKIIRFKPKFKII